MAESSQEQIPQQQDQPQDPRTSIPYDPHHNLPIAIGFAVNRIRSTELAGPDLHPTRQSQLDLKSKTTEDIITIRSFIEVLVLNHYVLRRKILVQDSNRVWFSIPTGGIKGKVGLTSFRYAIGVNYLSYSRDYVQPSTIEVVREWFLTIGYSKAFESC
ncbi:hypothetical protein Tco_1203682 [Tanacetum coccineum]